VRAYNVAGYSDYSNISGAYTGPCAPYDPSVSLGGEANKPYAVLEWKDGSKREDGFAVERIRGAGSEENWVTIGKVGANETKYTDETLACDSTYIYRVRAFNADGYSDPSNTFSVTVKPCGAPRAPSNLSTTTVPPSQINLAWTDNSTNENGFTIERIDSDGASFWTQIAKVETNITFYNDANVKCGKAFSYRVRAFNTDGDSDYSNVASATLSCKSIGADLRETTPTTSEPVNTTSAKVVSGAATPTEATSTEATLSAAAPAAVLSVPASQIWRSYYFAGSRRVAMRETTNSSDTVYYFVADHLGSTSLTLDANGNEIPNSRQKYYPFGETRGTATSPTDRQFTGQRAETGLGSLYDYGARFYSPVLGRFLSADVVVPQPGRPQALNRYAYTYNNPLKYIDPTGHFTEDELKAFNAYTQEELDRIRQNDYAWYKYLMFAHFGDTTEFSGNTGTFGGSFGLNYERNNLNLVWQGSGPNGPQTLTLKQLREMAFPLEHNKIIRTGFDGQQEFKTIVWQDNQFDWNNPWAKSTDRAVLDNELLTKAAQKGTSFLTGLLARFIAVRLGADPNTANVVGTVAGGVTTCIFNCQDALYPRVGDKMVVQYAYQDTGWMQEATIEDRPKLYMESPIQFTWKWVGKAP
jgi:RHS repeat-associated protein